jgi:hypothetical protein
MTPSQSGATQLIRISAEDVMAQMATGRPVIVLDTRAPHIWSESRLKVRGAIRIDRDHLHIDSSWPKDRLTVVY